MHNWADALLSHGRRLAASSVALIRVPVALFLWAAAFLQFLSVLWTPALKPEALSVPDLIPPMNTVVLALLWWRVSRLEKDSDYFRDRMDKANDREYDKGHENRGSERNWERGRDRRRY